MSSTGFGWACDTSVAIASVDPNHDAHQESRRVVSERKPVLAGHAAVETFSVLTRLPVPLRVSAAVARDLMRRVFGPACWPAAGAMDGFLDDLADAGIVGGATYDALVAFAATTNGLTLLTRGSTGRTDLPSTGNPPRTH